MSSQKTLTMLALVIFLGGAFFLGFSNSGFSSLLAQTVKSTNVGPTNLAASLENSPGPRVLLTWQDNSINETGFSVQQSGPNTSSSFLEIQQAATNQTSTYYSLATTTPGTYYYQVRANISGGLPTGTLVKPSNIAELFYPGPLNPPSNLVASSTSNSISLNWTDNSNNETGFAIERSAPNTTSSFTVIATSSANAPYFNDMSAATGTTYAYRVRAFSGPIYSAYSNTVIGTRSAPPVTINAPSNLVASSTSSSIDLSWVDNASNETAFWIERSGPNTTSSFGAIATTSANTVYFRDYSVPATGTYSYRVKAFDSMTSSTYSNTASAARTPITVNAPTNLTAGVVTTSTQLLWTDNSNNETGFSIERSATNNSSSFSVIATTSANTNFFADSWVATGTYWYRLRAYSGNIYSNYSNITSITRQPAIINAPSNLIASSTSNSVYLSWTDNSDNEYWFEVERSGPYSTSSFSVIATTSLNYFNNTSVATGTYTYRVRAVNYSTYSAYSANASATVSAPVVMINPPSNLVASSTSNSIYLSWMDNSTNEYGFEIQRWGPYPSLAIMTIATSGTNISYYNDTSVATGTYTYRVRAFNYTTNSAFSNNASSTH